MVDSVNSIDPIGNQDRVASKELTSNLSDSLSAKSIFGNGFMPDFDKSMDKKTGKTVTVDGEQYDAVWKQKSLEEIIGDKTVATFAQVPHANEKQVVIIDGKEYDVSKPKKDGFSLLPIYNDL